MGLPADPSSSPSTRASAVPGLLFAVTTLVSAFLLFQVQPLISKSILPWFGGSAAVWTTCMLFFQTLLFGGYAYAHFSEHIFGRNLRAGVHLALLAVSLVFLPIAPNREWAPTGTEDPAWRIIGLLTVCIGLPYFVISSTGPLVQAWFARLCPGKSPYRLYSLSNAGSLVALLTYPVLIEPNLNLKTQSWWWSGGFVLFAVCSALGTVLTWRQSPVDAVSETPLVDTTAAAPPTWTTRLLWIVLPAFASLMLLATTNHVCQDVAVIPFLWVIPLSLYLLTFIISFDHERWYQRGVWCVVTLLLAFLGAGLDELETLIQDKGPQEWDFEINYVYEIVVFFSLMFAICLLCHGELVRLRPAPAWLTSFYLMISAGGAIGGLFVGLFAPRIFTTFFEWKIGLFGSFAIAGLVAVKELYRRLSYRVPFPKPETVAIAVGLFGVLIISGLVKIVIWQTEDHSQRLVETRNFYGTVTVTEWDADDPERHRKVLWSGNIQHGIQFVDPVKRRLVTTYYHPESGVGRVLTHFQQRPNLRVGAIGLGVGTLAAYVQPGQQFRFYEINPEMLRVAETSFTYLSDVKQDGRGTVEVALGDARLTMQNEPPQRYDVLVLDAFSGDAVPAHLLTKEAFEVYDRHLSDNGVICAHITNSYLNLYPVMLGLAREGGWQHVRVITPPSSERAIYYAEWVIFTRDASLLEALRAATANSESVEARSKDADEELLWTDEFSNLFRILQM